MRVAKEREGNREKARESNQGARTERERERGGKRGEGNWTLKKVLNVTQVVNVSQLFMNTTRKNK